MEIISNVLYQFLLLMKLGSIFSNSDFEYALVMGGGGQSYRPHLCVASAKNDFNDFLRYIFELLHQNPHWKLLGFSKDEVSLFRDQNKFFDRLREDAVSLKF